MGSWNAYNEFMRLKSQISIDDVKGTKAITYTENSIFSEEDIDEDLARVYKIEECFSKVVYSKVDPTVGGMVIKIRAIEGENTFQYMEGMIVASSSWPQKIQSGESIKFLQGADQGSFCCNVYQSSQNYCCYMYENNCGIVYTDEVFIQEI